MLDGNILPESRQKLRPKALSGRVAISPQAIQVALIVLGAALVTFILYLYVLPNSQMDAAEVRIAELQRQKAALERENAAIQQQIARNSDIKTLEDRAKRLGMGPAPSAIYLRLPDSGAAAALNEQPETTSAQPLHELLRERLSREQLEEWLRTVRINVSQTVESVFQRLGQP